MNKPNSVEIPLNDQTKFRLNEINEIKDYFYSEIRERKMISRKLSKYVATFDYADKIFIVLSATFGTLSVVSHATAVGIPIGLAGASLPVLLSLITGVVKKIIKCDKKEEKEHDKIIMPAKSKLNRMETLMS